jgi:hypothetical protein
MLDQLSESGPIRFSHLNASQWVESGYSANSTQMFLDAIQESLTSPNYVPELHLAESAMIR